ncbi:SDR family oxidoreductase [candidate division KSB1 bacterium]|nr:SDR family oxidoreductase [candidate division KSB1 bacterium]
MEFDRSNLILLTGATGYVGGRLLNLLQNRGFRVRCLARQPAFLQDRLAGNSQVVQGDILQPQTLPPALADVHTAYYLVHALSASHDFEKKEEQAAQNFGRAARQAGVQRIIYLGGLGDEKQELSPHLRSRQKVGRILRECGVPTLELRASIVLGSGSLSFEMIRSLTEKLPVMTTPKWVRVPAQPIGIDDLLDYLLQALEIELAESRVVEIGGSDRLSYLDLMREYARQRGLKRWIVPVPVLTPGLSSLWLGLVTPLYARVGRKLIDSIQHPTVVTNDLASQLFSVRPRTAAEAIRRALVNEEREFAETRWSDALSSSTGQKAHFGGVRIKSRLIDSRLRTIPAPPHRVFAPIARIGGETGWYAANGLWRLRGAIDLIFGGVGMRRGRPQNRDLRPGDALDFWRVEKYEPPHRLKLIAEMKLPGKAWLEFEVEENDEGSLLRQTATFYPHGLGGLLYWYGIYPLHTLVFRCMIAQIGRAAFHGAEKKP